MARLQRLFIRGFNLICLLILCVACSSKAEEGFRMNIGGDPPTLDPRKARDLRSMALAKMFFEGLTRVNLQEVAELAMAERVEVSSDKKTYTFHLRDAVWSTGAKVTAHDFLYAWSKVLSPNFPADQAFQMYVIKNGRACKEGKTPFEKVGVKALDDQTLRVELEYPIPYFLDLVALPVFFPVVQQIDEKHPHWAGRLQTIQGNGPFCMKSWKHNDQIVAVKSLTYWDASHVKLNQIDLLMIPGEDLELAMYRKGELDWAGSPLSTLPVGSLAFLKKDENLQIRPFLGTYFFKINIEGAPFQNPLMRKAFALAINRSDIVSRVTQGDQLPATGLIPPALAPPQEAYFSDGDVSCARQTFEEALRLEGMTREGLPPITLIYTAGERNHLIAQAVQEQWREALGVVVQLHSMERKTLFDRVSKRNFQIVAGSWTADFKDAINFLEVFKFKNSGSNNTAWENDRYQELLDKLIMVSHPKERQKIFRECESILMQEMPIIPVFYYTLAYVAKSYVKGVALSDLGGIDLKWAYLEKGAVK